MADEPYKTERPKTSGAPYLTKGTKIRAKWFAAKPPGTYSLSGFQMKFVGSFVEVVGTIRHLRGDDPVAPRKVKLFIEPEGEVPEGVKRERPYGCTCEGHDQLVAVNADHVTGIVE